MQRHAGDNAEDQPDAVDLPAQFRQHRSHHLRLYRQHQDIGGARRFGIVSGDLDAVTFAQGSQMLAPWIGGHDIFRREQALLEQTFDHRLAHHARADKHCLFTVESHRDSLVPSLVFVKVAAEQVEAAPPVFKLPADKIRDDIAGR